MGTLITHSWEGVHWATTWQSHLAIAGKAGDENPLRNYIQQKYNVNQLCTLKCSSSHIKSVKKNK